jgi:hypothetical protein
MVTLFLLVLNILFLSLSCSEGGDVNSLSPDTELSDPSLDATGNQHITGKLEIEGAEPSSFFLRIYDLEKFSHVDMYSSLSGYLRYPTSDLSYGSSYSFAVMSATGHLVGFLDFSDDGGLQGAITYDGGLGFDLGNINIISTDVGYILKSNRVSLAGSFYVDFSRTGEQSYVGLPDGVGHLSLGRQLIVNNSLDLFNLFVERHINPDGYEFGLQKFSSIFIDIDQVDQDLYRSINLSRYYDWMSGARITNDPFLAGGILDEWSKSNFSITSSSPDFGISVFVNSSSLLGALLPISFHRFDGLLGPNLQYFLGSKVLLPPLIDLVDFGGNEFLTLEEVEPHAGLLSLLRLENTAHNPLLKFRQEILGTHRPKYSKVSLRFRYFNGNDFIENAQTTLGPLWGRDRQHVSLNKTEYVYTWKLKELALSRLISGSDDQLIFELPADLLSKSSVGSSADRLKIEVIFSGESQRSGSVYWIDLRP